MKGKTLKTIAVINQKGGVGKSTTALSLGAGLILRGYKVLFVDLDAQGNLSNSMRATGSQNVLEALRSPQATKEQIEHTKTGDLLASTPTLAGADIIFNGVYRKEYRLRETLEYVKHDYDFCIIDTPPALGILTVNALTASYGALIPALADYYSLQGIGQLNRTIETVKRVCNPSLHIIGIVITRFNKRLVIRRDIAKSLEQIASQLNTRLFHTRIRECTALSESQIARETIYEYAPRSNATTDFKEFIKEFLKVTKE